MNTATVAALGYGTLKRDRCTSRLVVDGQEILIWAITGGTMAVAFPDYSFTERANYCERLNEHVHPSRTASEGPTPDDFDGGVEFLKDFVRRNVPLALLRAKRTTLLTERFGQTLESARFHDTDNACYFRCELNLYRGLSPVTVSAKYYAGRCDETTAKFASPRWQRLAAYFNPRFDAGFRGGTVGGWESLTGKEFDEIVEVLAAE